MFVVDLGFGGAKWFSDGGRGTVKSCFRKSKGGISYQADRYLVGDKALLETGSRYLRTVEELVDMYPLFVSACAKDAGVTKDDVLVVGLPYDYWKVATEQKKGTSNPVMVLKDTLSRIDGESPVDFERVIVFPQGLGGIKAYLAGSPAASGDILGVDIGFNTVIYTLYSCAQKEILAGKTFYKKGIHDLAVNGLLPRIQEHLHGVTLTPIELDYVMRTGDLQRGFDRIDIRPEVEEAAKAYVNDMLSLVIGDMKAHDGVMAFNTVLFFGGGARLLAGKIAASKVKAIVMEEPEYANATGFRVRAEELLADDQGV